MRVGELSRRSGVSVPSIKYYLREGLLAPGERTGPNQASYGEGHIHRLRLIRALIDVGGLSVAGTRDVLATVDDDADLHRVLGTVQAAVSPVADPVEDDDHSKAAGVIDDLVARRGWRVHDGNPGRRAAIDVLATWARLGAPDDVDALDAYAEAVETLARAEVGASVTGGVATGSGREQVVESVVLGIVLGGSLLTALRAMAQEDASARRLQ